jgi:hypothetical protein
MLPTVIFVHQALGILPILKMFFDECATGTGFKVLLKLKRFVPILKNCVGSKSNRTAVFFGRSSNIV